MLLVSLNGSIRVSHEDQLADTLAKMGLPCAKAYALDILGDLRQGHEVAYPTQLGDLLVVAG